MSNPPHSKEQNPYVFVLLPVKIVVKRTKEPKFVLLAKVSEYI